VPQNRPLRLALLLWLALVAAVSVRTLLRPASHSVFPIFALSTQHWWHDQPLYADYKPLDFFRYPPVFAVALTPLSALGLRLGGVLWSWLGIAVLLAGLHRYARQVAGPAWSPARHAVFLSLCALGALRGLWNAQSNALVVGLLLLAGAYLCRAATPHPPEAKRGRCWWLVAGVLAVAVWVKLTPLAPALLLCALWPRQLGGRLVVILAAIGLLPFLTRPPYVVLHHYHDWLGHLTGTSSKRWAGFRDAWTICLAIRQMLSGAAGPLPLEEPLHAPGYRLAQVLSAAAAGGWCLWQKRRGREPRLLIHASLSMGMAWLMLLGPAIEHATYVFLAPFLCAALLQPGPWQGGRRLIQAAFVLVMVLGWGALTRPLEPVVPLLAASLPLGTSLFLLWLVADSRAQSEARVQGKEARQECLPYLSNPVR
jgi:hypothetical protein